MGKKIPNNVRKAYAVASLIGTILKTSTTGDPKLTTLSVQANRAMRVFFAKAGAKTYFSIAEDVGSLWGEMALKHDKTLNRDEMTVFVQMMCSLISPKDYKDFLAVSPYKTHSVIQCDYIVATTHKKYKHEDLIGVIFNKELCTKHEKEVYLLSSILELDGRLCEMFDVSQYANEEILRKALIPPVKKTKQAKKARDKNTSKQERHKKEVVEHKARKKRKMTFLSSVRAKAKAQRELDEQEAHDTMMEIA